MSVEIPEFKLLKSDFLPVLEKQHEVPQSGFHIDSKEIPDLSTQKTLGPILGKSKSWFSRHRWAKTGIRFTKVGRTPMYSKQSVLDYFAEREIETKEGE